MWQLKWSQYVSEIMIEADEWDRRHYAYATTIRYARTTKSSITISPELTFLLLNWRKSIIIYKTCPNSCGFNFELNYICIDLHNKVLVRACATHWPLQSWRTCARARIRRPAGADWQLPAKNAPEPCPGTSIVSHWWLNLI